MFILYFATSVKAVRDLVFCEIIYRDSPLLKIKLRKLFHILLPISQITICICTFVYSTFCNSIHEQTVLHTLLTASSGYMWLLCYLFNALHWGFLTAAPEDQKYRKWINGFLVFFFIVMPIVLLLIISISIGTGPKRFTFIIHTIEMIYRGVLDIVVMVVVFVSWYVLYSKLKKLRE